MSRDEVGHGDRTWRLEHNAEPDRSRGGAHPSVDEAIEMLGTTERGLTSSEAATRLGTCGANVLATRRVTAFGVLARQLHNPLLILLLSAAAVSAATGDSTDGGIIAAIVLMSVGLGFVNEYRSEQAVAAPHANIRREIGVWRDGEQQQLDVRALVPGEPCPTNSGASAFSTRSRKTCATSRPN